MVDTRQGVEAVTVNGVVFGDYFQDQVENVVVVRSCYPVVLIRFGDHQTCFRIFVIGVTKRKMPSLNAFKDV